MLRDIKKLLERNALVIAIVATVFLGILSLVHKHGNPVLNLACRKACNMERVNYHFIKEQAEYIKDQYEKENEAKQLSLLPPDHENIRGDEYYK